jgi:diguanylate cyclase (GGDEF)-like protein
MSQHIKPSTTFPRPFAVFAQAAAPNQNKGRHRRRQGDQSAQSLELRRLRRARARWSAERDTLKQTISTLKTACETDPLTGVYNRRGLEAAYARLIKCPVAAEKTHALVFLDGDGFGAINKIYGDDVGDRVIVAIAHSLEAQTRRSDIVARKGGDEFIVLLRNVKLDDLERAIYGRRGLQARINRHTHIDLPDRSLVINCSMGAVAFTADEPLEAVLKRADAAMRANKLYRKAVHLLAVA